MPPPLAFAARFSGLVHAGPLTFGFAFQGMAQMLQGLGLAGERVTDELERKMHQVAILLQGQIQRHIVGSRATNPPDVLGVDSGRLRQSIGNEVRRLAPGVVQALVGPQRVVYGAVHELGSRAIGHPEMNIPERPYIRPAVKELQEHILRELGSAFRAEVVWGTA